MPFAAVIELKNITKSYVVDRRKIKVLQNASLELKKGELSCIIGPNGSGKTTLIKIAAGIETASSGGQRQTGKIAYLPQQDSLLPWLTLRQNIELPGRINKNLTPALHKEIDKYLKKYKLSRFADFYPGEISGGMKQKTALIRAIVYRPEIILLDEPFSALDAITRIQMQQMLSDLWLEYKPTILCVTHDIDEAIFLSDRIFVMSARPGTIAETYKVNLPRPRHLDDLAHREALKLKKDLHRRLLS